MKEKVLKFINNYKHISKKEIEYAFNNGNCYWFAHILHTVFNGEIYYLPIENHFICKIEDEYYDLTEEQTKEIFSKLLEIWNNNPIFDNDYN